MLVLPFLSSFRRPRPAEAPEPSQRADEARSFPAWLTWGGIGLAFLAAGLWLGQRAWIDPEVPYLARAAPAEWILFPRAPSTIAHPLAPLTTTFTRTFTLERVPARARLRVRMHRSGSVRVNDAELLRLDAPGEDWKSERGLEVADRLRSGENRIEARVEGSFGPPALWLALELDGETLASDTSWTSSCAGSAERPARLASEPMSAWSAYSPTGQVGAVNSPALNPSPLEGLRARTGTVALCALASAFSVLGARVLARRTRLATSGLGLALFLGLVTLGVTALFWNNRALSPFVGFDSRHHVDYVDWVRTNGSIPYADQGFQMYQPPLYYALAAAGLRLAGKTQLEEDSAWIAHALGAGALLLQAVCIALSMRLLFPGRPGLAFAGACFGVLVPMHLYLYQYVTNEGLSAALVSLSLVLALRITTGRAEGWSAHGLLGLVLGAAMLTKVSALLALLVILTVLGARLVVRRERSPLRWIGTLGATLAGTLLVSGWYYLRVHARFGQFLVTNVGELSGNSWWQDPGIRTFGDYARFGRSLARPLYGSLHSCLDALYSSAWGDGMLGGLGRIDVRPPWDYSLMAVGFGLALLPTLALALGAGRALLRFARKPAASWGLLLGLPFLTLTALLVLTLEQPSYAQAKWIYTASLVVPFSAFVALGLDALARRIPRGGYVMWTLFGTWALTSAAAFWARPGLEFEHIPPTEGDEAWFWSTPEASRPGTRDLGRLAASVALAADNADAHVALGDARLNRGDVPGAIEAARNALAVDPSHAYAHYLLGLARLRTGEGDATLEQLGLAAGLEPTNSGYALDLASALAAAGRPRDAVPVLERTRAVLLRRGEAVPPELERRRAELSGLLPAK